MDFYEALNVALIFAVYGLPIVIGLSVSRFPTAMVLAVASYCGLCLSVWSVLGPLFVPLVGLVDPRLATLAVLSVLLTGALQAAVLAAVGFGMKRLILKVRHSRGLAYEGQA
jgi:hypothetical protein